MGAAFAGMRRQRLWAVTWAADQWPPRGGGKPQIELIWVRFRGLSTLSLPFANDRKIGLRFFPL
jgi:hypothetical protein